MHRQEEVQKEYLKKNAVYWTLCWTISVCAYRVVQATKFGFLPAAAFSGSYISELINIISLLSLAVFLGAYTYLICVIINRITEHAQKIWIVGSAVILVHVISSVLFSLVRYFTNRNYDYSSSVNDTFIYIAQVVTATVIALTFITIKQSPSNIRLSLLNSFFVLIGAGLLFFFFSAPPKYYLGTWLDYSSLNGQQVFVIVSFSHNKEGSLEVSSHSLNPAMREVLWKKIFIGDIRWSASIKDLKLYKIKKNGMTDVEPFAIGVLSRDAKHLTIRLLNRSESYQLQRLAIRR